MISFSRDDHTGFKTDNKAALRSEIISNSSGIGLYESLSDIAGLELNGCLPATMEDSDEEKRMHGSLRHWERGDDSIYDVLGEYDPLAVHITMYVKLIEAAAKELR